MQDKSPMTHLENICEIIMGQSPKGETYNTIGNGTPLLNGPTEFGEHHPKPVLYTTSPTKLCKKGDLLFCVRGSTTGRMNWANAEYCIGRGVGAFRAKSDEIDTRFIYYTLVCELPRLLSRCAGSVFPNLSRSDFETFDIVWPDRNIRSATASILGALDDKIELNRMMNETLEAMARTIFKSWFIDFDPIPGFGLHKEWQDSPLGRIPKGWRVVTFTNTVEIFGGGTPKTSVPEYWGSDIPWYAVGDAPKGSDIYVIDTEKKITKAGVENSATRILPIGTTIVSARGTVGKLALTGVPMAMNQTCYGLRGKFENSSAYTFLSTLNLISTLQQRTHGSIFDTITRDTLASLEVVLPSSKIIERFEATVAPVMEHVLNNLRQSRTLAAIRDALLPKLTSGELRVHEADKFLGAML